MIGFEVVINNINLKTYGIVERVDYPKLSKEFIYKENTSNPESLEESFYKSKEVKIYLRVITKDFNKKDNERLCDEIVSKISSKNNMFFSIENKNGFGIVTNVSYEIFRNTSLFEITINNELGYWVSEIKSVNLNTDFRVNTIDDIKDFEIEVTPSSNKIKLAILDKFIQLENVYSTGNIKINFKNKTVIQDNKHVELSLDSTFFVLKNGSNRVLITGGSGVIKYREVISL